MVQVPTKTATRGSRALLIAAGFLGLSAGVALAGSVEAPASEPEPAQAREEGSTSRLEGISFGLVSRADLLSRVRGGLSDSAAPRYRGHLDLMTEIDTTRLGLWPGGRIVLVAQNGHGQGLTEGDVGDVQVLSNIDAHSFTQMSEWWLEQHLFGGRARVKVGRQDAGADFACVDYGGEFLNSSFGLIPTAPVPTFPDPALGLSAFVDVTPEISVGVGVFAPTPMTWGRIRGETYGVEVSFAPRSRGQGPPSRYRAGLWYQRDPIAPDAAALTSVYAGVDRQLLSEGPGGQGLRGFVQAGTSSGAPNGISDYLGAGLVYTGMLPGRDEDSVGVGVAFARIPGLSGTRSAETDIELLYRVSPFPWLTIQPTLHYVVRPGGRGDDAVVVGLRVETEF